MKQVIIDFDKCDEHEKEYIKDCLNLVGCDHWRTEQDINADLLEACGYALSVLESIPESIAYQIADFLDESINTLKIEKAINKAKGE